MLKIFWLFCCTSWEFSVSIHQLIKLPIQIYFNYRASDISSQAVVIMRALAGIVSNIFIIWFILASCGDHELLLGSSEISSSSDLSSQAVVTWNSCWDRQQYHHHFVFTEFLTGSAWSPAISGKFVIELIGEYPYYQGM